MKFFVPVTLAVSLLGAPIFADGHATGDAAAGEKVFRKCKSCHKVADAAGDVIAKGGRTGPNLYGIYTRVAGTHEDFKYGDSIVAAGQAGLAWNEEDFVKYMGGPKTFLAEYLDDKKAKSRMSFKLRKDADAADVWAYLVSIGPEVAADATETPTSD